MANNSIDDLLAFFDGAIARLSPTVQKKMAREIARDLRKRNAQRMRAQVSPDSQAWQARTRKAEKGAMFKKLRQAKHFKIRNRGNAIRVGFFGNSGFLARVHHYGLRQTLSYGTARYPQRELIGINHDDISATREIVMRYLTDGE